MWMGNPFHSFTCPSFTHKLEIRMEIINLDIKGMTCSGCVNSVTRVLEAVPGVTTAEVTLTPGSARVQFDPALANAAQLKAAVEEAGYDVA